MGYAICTGQCAGCRRIFSFNPVRVPSIRVNGVREPLCRTCVDTVNAHRLKSGLEVFPIPEDAYEPVDESELMY